MILTNIDSIVELLAIMIALLICLFQYISTKSKSLIYAIVFFLCSMMSSYYWTVYLIIFCDDPVVSDMFYYSGWNIAYLVLLALILSTKSKEEKRYFNLLMLLPIPINIWQLTLYLPYGGELNSIYQVSILTIVSCYCIQGICWYLKNMKNGVKYPFIAISVLFMAIFSFGMWTTSSLDGFVSKLFYPFSFLNSANYLFGAWTVSKYSKELSASKTEKIDMKYQRILKNAYLIVVMLCFIGGSMFGKWMKTMVDTELSEASESSIYNVIPIVLFIISLFLVVSALAIIFVVNLVEKLAENNDLKEARKLADQSNSAKSEFLANMSHEIRTPINAMLGMNEIILRESLLARDLLQNENDNVRSVLDDICIYSGNIDIAGNNLISIINDILDFSKIEAGKLEITNVNYKLSSVLNDVSNMISIKTESKNLKFNVFVDETLPDSLFGDEVRVRQIMTNLLNNAVKYTDSGSVTLYIKGETVKSISDGQGDTVDLESENSNDNTSKDNLINLVISVKDTGIGIRPEDIDKLFSKFQRIDLVRNSTVEGTGLGLAITQNLLGLMGGEVSVESEYGKGSTFTAMIPQKVISNEPVGDFREKFAKRMKDAHGEKEHFVAPNAHILIVDDTEMNIKVVLGLLKNSKIKIDTALSGKKAVELAKSTPYDAILMDQRMPNMDGTEALKLIRTQTDGVNIDTPIICLTADALSGSRERYLADGFTDYLTKPVNGITLENMLIKYIPKDKICNADSVDFAGEEKVKSVTNNYNTSKCNDAEDGFNKEIVVTSDNIFDYLNSIGLDTETALKYSANDKEFYISLLQDYVNDYNKKSIEIQKLYDESNWKDYTVFVHALKTTSKIIGAIDMYENAATMQGYADKVNEALIRKDHDKMMAKYLKLVNQLKEVCSNI